MSPVTMTCSGSESVAQPSAARADQRGVCDATSSDSEAEPLPRADSGTAPRLVRKRIPHAAEAPSALSARHAENMLRVDAERIDSVLNLVGELIIGKSMLQQALNEFAQAYPKEPMRGKFADAMAFQARVLNDLQRSVMKIRMVPVDQLVPALSAHGARCGAGSAAEKSDLELSGQETDLDKGILDAIAEPLTHLVRNAVSHGIESAEERTRAGQSRREEQSACNAYHQGNQVVVEISDDGRGIDAQKIRAKAIELGLITAEEAAGLTEAETLELDFPARLQHRGGGHRSLRPRRRHGCRAERAAPPEGYDRHRDSAGPGHDIPAEAAA